MSDPVRTRTLDDTTRASDPGRLRLSEAKLKLIRPDLFGVLGALRRIWQPLPQRTYISEQLQHGDSRAAVVVSVSPLLIAAYTDELDCIAMLRFPDSFAHQYALAVGSRLLTVNTYRRTPPYQQDLMLGPNLIKRWTGFHPLIAEFVSEDMERIENRKATICEAEWDRTWQFGKGYLALRPGVARDGRPVYSSIPAKC